jgi:hypothetical protein
MIGSQNSCGVTITFFLLRDYTLFKSTLAMILACAPALVAANSASALGDKIPIRYHHNQLTAVHRSQAIAPFTEMI